MKQILLLLGLFCLVQTAGFSQATGYSTDFESFTLGTYIGVAEPSFWTTWNNKPGTTEDAVVSSEKAFSGTKALKFEGVSTTGGPQDVIFKYGGKLVQGKFVQKMKMYILPGNGAYFNLQAEPTVGQLWAFDMFFRETGVAEATLGSAGATVVASGSFPHDKWFEVKLDVDLTNNVWKILIDDVEIGSFANTNNSIAILDLFPYNPTSGLSNFYVDDFEYSHIVAQLPAIDAAVTKVNVRPKGLLGQKSTVSATIRNVGADPITGCKLSLSDGTNVADAVLTGLNIPSLAIYTHKFTTDYTFTNPSPTLTVTVSDVNGGSGDATAGNNTASAKPTTVVPTPNRMVVAEERTGTWCTWCPRGAVFMDSMAKTYPDFFAGIAIHNTNPNAQFADPMTLAAYDGGIGALVAGFSGFPQVTMNRNTWFDPSGLEDRLFTDIVNANKFTLKLGAKQSATPGQYDLSVTYTSGPANVIEKHKIVVVLTEDGMHGTTGGWAQVNAYSGGASGPMGGFENLPSPVPANLMTYNHVARALISPINGTDGSIPSPYLANKKGVYNKYTMTVPADAVEDHLNIIAFTVNSSGKVDNATSATIAEALANGFTGVKEEVFEAEKVNIGPNPADAFTTVSAQMKIASDVQILIHDLTGKVIDQYQLNGHEGVNQWHIPVSTLDAGLYTLTLIADEDMVTKKLYVHHN